MKPKKNVITPTGRAEQAAYLLKIFLTAANVAPIDFHLLKLKIAYASNT